MQIGTRGFGFFQLASGALLLAPLVLGLHWLASVIASLLALGALLYFGGASASPVVPAASGRLARGAVVAAAVVTLGFLAWERDDPLTLGTRILLKAQHWRTHELDWQLGNDVASPKVGDLAPDFELHDPSGAHSVRLSSFFGKRPVALIFGSYT